jgi:flagellum-specific peptidoglycan hydrolase FlgJ
MESVENDDRQVFTEVKQEPKRSWMSQLNMFSAPEQAPELRQRLSSLTTAEVQAYIKRFAPVAKTEQDKYGVPVSIILASGLLHSQAGQREMTKQGNNYFALDCSSDWVGATVKETGNCYRSYQNAWTSFRDHSLFVTTGHYANLPKLGDTNYSDWAIALEDMGYGGTPDLGKQLLYVIDTWQLFQYD